MTKGPINKLCGDGDIDDTSAIQALLDENVSTVYLPPPSKHYLISRTLKIHSNQTLLLDRLTHIRLRPGSDCLMITNCDHNGGNHNIAVIGGIWDMDNVRQSPNPIMGLGEKRGKYDPDRYLGICMRFVGVTHFTLKSVTFRDPVTFCTQFARARYFTVDDVVFDFQHSNPLPVNMDGIHIDGCCRFGRISNLKGTTNDDLIALNADDDEIESPCLGPIEDISIDGIYAPECHSAIRFLSSGSPVRRISVSNVFGSFYQYAFGFTKFFHHRNGIGLFDNITLQNIHCSKATRHSCYQKDGLPVFPLIWCERGTRIGALSISELSRFEESVAAPCIHVEAGAELESLVVQNASFENALNESADFLVNEGIIGQITLNNVRLKGGDVGHLLRNRGEIGSEDCEVLL